MLIDLNLCEKSAIVIGDGEEALKRVKQLADSRASPLILVSTRREVTHAKGKRTTVRVKKWSDYDFASLFRNERPSFVVVLPNIGEDMVQKVARIARRYHALTYVVDRPALSDISMPAVARLGKNVRVAISTGGASPAMAGLLKRRVERTIKSEDLLQIELQGRVRDSIKSQVNDFATRKALIFQIIQSRRIRSLLKKKSLDEATKEALSMIVRKGTDSANLFEKRA